MKPVLVENEYVFGTLDRFDYEQVLLLNPLSTFQEKKGLTVILTKEKADEFNISYSGVFKCITLNVHSSLDAVGLTAAVSKKLMQSNISANVVATYYHAHVFIALKGAEQALADLNALTQQGISG